MEIMLPYFTAWNVDAIKFYINLLNRVNDKESTIRINNFHCDFEETIEFLNGIFEIKGNIKNHLAKPYTKSLAIPLINLNIQMIILTYGGRMSPKHCSENFTLEQALTYWRNSDNRIPKEAEIWWGNKKITTKQFLIANMAWNTKINLMIKGDGGDPKTESLRAQAWKYFENEVVYYTKFKRLNKWNRNTIFVNWKNQAYSRKKLLGKILE
jgi:hypothetical protein